MRKLCKLTTVAALLASASAAQAVTLTFDPNQACQPTGICGDGNTISNSYGDIAGILDITYRSVQSHGSSQGVTSAFYWNQQYGDLDDVAYAGNGTTLEVIFTLLNPAQHTITFNSVDYAGYRGTYQTVVSLYTLDYALRTGSGATTAPGTGHATFSGPETFTNGYRLHFGPEGFYAAIDNLSFTINDVNVAAVPEPATWGMMIAGFGLIGGAMRSVQRRKSLRTHEFA